MLIFYIARQLESTEMQILSSLNMGGKKSLPWKARERQGDLRKRWSTNLTPMGGCTYNTNSNLLQKYRFACAHMSSVCLASGASAWSHVAPGDSPVGSPHTPECMPLNCVLECSLSLLSLAFLHSAFFFSSWKQLVVWWTELLGATGNINWVQPYLCNSVQSL